jgi:hypothetical protein
VARRERVGGPRREQVDLEEANDHAEPENSHILVVKSGNPDVPHVTVFSFYLEEEDEDNAARPPDERRDRAGTSDALVVGGKARRSGCATSRRLTLDRTSRSTRGSRPCPPTRRS